MDYVSLLIRMSRPEQLTLIALVYTWGVLIVVSQGVQFSITSFITGLVAGTFVSVSIHFVNEYADVETDLSSQFRIQGLPTILFIDHKGDEVHRVVGYRPPGQFLDEMDRALRAYRGEWGS